MLSLLGKPLMFLLDAFFWIIVIQVAVSWLIAFEVLNTRSPQARNLIDLMDRITGPVYRPLRKYVPAIAGIDVSPIIIIFGIYLLKDLVGQIFF